MKYPVNNYSATKAKMVHRGTTLRRWAKKNNFATGTVYNAVRGLRNGIESVKIRNRLAQFLND